MASFKKNAASGSAQSRQQRKRINRSKVEGFQQAQRFLQVNRIRRVKVPDGRGTEPTP
jgi:hypothetical protein